MQTVLFVLDFFFYEGCNVLFAVGLSVLKLHEKMILQELDPDVILEHLNQPFNVSAEELMTVWLLSYFLLPYYK